MSWNGSGTEHPFEAGLCQALEEFMPAASRPDVQLIFLNQPSFVAAEALMAAAPGTSILPVVLTSETLWVGPLLTGDCFPFKDSCLCCALRRFTAKRSKRGRSVIPGALEIFLPLVAAGVACLLEAAGRSHLRTGTVWLLDLRSGHMEVCVVAGQHQCQFCGLPRKPEELSTGGLRTALFPVNRGVGRTDLSPGQPL